MKTKFLAAAGIAGCLLAAGCGTIFTRGKDNVIFGAYPFEAVGFDLDFISRTFEGDQEMMGMVANGRLFLCWGLVSLPFDLAIDVLACPIDLVAWIVGCHKDASRSR